MTWNTFPPVAFSLGGTKPPNTSLILWFLLQVSVSHIVLGLRKGESEASRKASWRRR